MKKIVSILFLFISICTHAQKIELVASNPKTSLRGLCVVNNSIIWASGSNGVVAKSNNGGKSFEWLIVKGYEKRDFRDIEAFDDKTALIMAVGEPAIILKTTDGGRNWKEVFNDPTPGMFLDAMDFVSSQKLGAVIGDPIDGNIYIAFTEDGGNTWIKDDRKFPLQKGEAMFASSGTNLKIIDTSSFYLGELVYITGGKKSRLFFDDEPNNIDMIQGTDSQGANSFDISKEDKKLIMVGGDFLQDSISTNNCVILTEVEDGEMDYTKPQTPPHGYKSCIAYISKNTWICCGSSGVDISLDGGNNWKTISADGYNCCARAKLGYEVFLAGKNGTIAKLIRQVTVSPPQ